MSKRFTDTDKYKKPFIRSLPGPYKLLWDYLYHECNHAGIWIVEFEIAQIYLGQDMQVDEESALRFFNQDEQRVFPISDGKKWFIKPFIDFQYGELNPDNRVHKSVITLLKKEKIDWVVKGLKHPLQGCKDKDMDKDKDKDMDKDKGDAREFSPAVRYSKGKSYEPQQIDPPDGPEKVIDYGQQKGIPREACEIYYDMRATDNFHRTDREGNWKPILNWFHDLALLYKKGALKPDKQNNSNKNGKGNGNNAGSTKGDKHAAFLTR